MKNINTYQDLIKAANGHLDEGMARQLADTIYDDSNSLWTDSKKLNGASSSFARGRAAQRLITNPALPDYEVEQLQTYASAPEVAFKKKLDSSGGFSSQPVKYMEGRKARIKYFTAKHGG